ncbi:protein NPC2-like protein [Dinothrombium tinctorium]|uniref:Protein NPC2-like protein n=1 Tax=Dinothrombium tinctorium TaxID=1965070 RepID=A0A3S3PJU4_9ACAR|nr:protein NPC2-like protein [Dinothrombium tinctorium]
MLKVTLVFCLATLWSLTFAILPRPCRDFPSFTSVNVSDCEGDFSPCPFVKGSNVTLTASFISNIDSQNTTIAVFGKITTLKIRTPFPISPNSGCFYGIPCPIKKNEEYTFQLTMPIRRLYPAIRVDTGLELFGDNNARIACVQFPARIQ